MSGDMYGVINGVKFNNIEEDNVLNNRIYDRNKPSQTLQPMFSIRPVSTKQAVMPVFDERRSGRVPINVYPSFSTQENFYPGSLDAPWSGFANHVSTESDLRNQNFALQRADQAVYVPNSTSDLYNSTVQNQGGCNEHPLLFSQQQFTQEPGLRPLEGMHNHTRQQLKDGQ